jgi:hypothetical protein
VAVHSVVTAVTVFVCRKYLLSLLKSRSSYICMYIFAVDVRIVIALHVCMSKSN